MAWDGRELSPEFARTIARKLCRDSLAWARTFAVHPRPSLMNLRGTSDGRPAGDASAAPVRHQVEGELFVEVLAYSLCLLEIRFSAATPADRDTLISLVRHECEVIMGQARWRRANRYRRLPAPASMPNDSRYAKMYPAGRTGGSGQARLTREMFEQFCQCTGLGSDVLVGKGENLASLVFYIAVHGVLSADGLPTREEVLKLLRTAGACRTHFQKKISDWLPVPAAARPPMAALAGSEFLTLTSRVGKVD